MEIVKSKDREFIDLVVSSMKPINSLSMFSNNNRQSLKEIISYLSQIKNENIIDDKQFSKLVILACANFIENEVEGRITKSIYDKMIFLLEKV